LGQGGCWGPTSRRPDELKAIKTCSGRWV